MGLWKALFGSKARQSAVPTASQRESHSRGTNAHAPAVRRQFEPAFKIGDRIDGRYEVHRILGGGMGEVYVVLDQMNANVLALKTFQNPPSKSWAQRHALEQAFEKEASSWIALDRHPSIVRALHVEKIHGRLFIGMEYIAPDEHRRNTLRHYLLGQPVPLQQALRWGVEFCHGMEHARGRGVLCHRDIKPDNILISSDGHVKITDFGLAAALDQWGTPKSSEALAAMAPGNWEGSMLTVVRAGRGYVAGTPGYMAPEVLRGEGADVRSDVYSFGIVLYQMVTGGPGVRLANRYESAPLVRVDTVLWPVIERCLRAEERSRYQSFGLLRADLEALLRKAGGVIAAPLEIKGLEAWEWSNKGFSLSALGREEEAVACYDRALEIKPREVVMWRNKGGALSALGRKEEALACYDRALEIDPRYGNAWLSKSDALSDLGRNEEAIACCDRALEIDPRFAGAWNIKGVKLLGMGRKEEAIACFDRTLEIDPKHANAWLRKGIALWDLGRSEEAITCCDRALEIDPRIARAWSNKGLALSAVGRWDEAIACYDRALEIDPRDAATWHNSYLALGALGRKEEAIGCCDRVLEIDPRHANAWLNKGVMLSALGRGDEAIACYDRALEFDPKFAFAWNCKGVKLSGMGRKEEAMACFDRTLEIDPSHANSWLNKGVLLSASGREDEAIACYDRALEIDPRFAFAWNCKGLALGALGRKEEAILCYDRALEIDSGFVLAWSNKGSALLTLGRKQEAVEAYRRFIACAPTSYKQQIQRAKEFIAELEGNARPRKLN